MKGCDGCNIEGRERGAMCSVFSVEKKDQGDCRSYDTQGQWANGVSTSVFLREEVVFVGFQ